MLYPEDLSLLIPYVETVTHGVAGLVGGAFGK